VARGDGDRLVRCERGHRHWGRYGAAGLLPVSDGHVLLQHRAKLTIGGGTWGIFGGARDSHEDAVAAALRETAEESTLPVADITVFGSIRDDHGGWAYDTVIGSAPSTVDVAPVSWESAGAAWVPLADVPGMKLYEPFAQAWPRLLTCLRRPVLVVDGANVVGSRPDGWWRDRAGAAARLRDSLESLRAVDGFAPFDVAHPEVVLVVEGAARHIADGDAVRVVSAAGSGDDTIVSTAEAAVSEGDAPCLVVTADRELRRRCAAVGADAVGPRWLYDRLDG
jgi:8-oxo-dGTP diphosphatase